MKGRVGRLITICLLVSAAGLLPLSAGCQRAKPPRVVSPPLVTPRVETPILARVAVATATAAAVASAGYPEPPATVQSQDAYPSTAEPTAEIPSTEAPPEPTEAPTAAPTAAATAAPTPTEVPMLAPTAVPTPEVAPPTPLPEIAYRVKGGDSVGSIAVLFNSTTAAILARNGLSHASLVRVGQTLIIPAASPQAIPTGSVIHHAVQAGETLDLIAGYYRTTAAAIQALNPAQSATDDLSAGTVLTVIAGSEAPPRNHVVQVGESLGLIAESYGITVQSLARANGLTDPSSIRVGQTLIVP